MFGVEGLDATTVATVSLAGLGAGSAVALWAMRSYVQAEVGRVESRLAIHENVDAEVHRNVTEGLADIKRVTSKTDAKMDWLIDRLIPRA
jgi:hypothetical protein